VSRQRGDIGQSELARRVRKILVRERVLTRDDEFPRDIINKLERQGKPEFPRPEIVMAIAEAVGRPVVEALEQLGYKFPANENVRINPDLAARLDELSWPAQKQLSDALPFLMGLAQKMVYGEPGEELLHAAEGSGEYKAPHPKGPLAGGRAKRGLKRS
jgi:hypothetical protein